MTGNDSWTREGMMGVKLKLNEEKTKVDIIENFIYLSSKSEV